MDKWFNRAVEAGCTVRMPLMDMFWGDRFGQVIDPFGHTWGMATHTEDLTPAEMRRRQQEFFAKMSAGKRSRFFFFRAVVLRAAVLFGRRAPSARLFVLLHERVGRHRGHRLADDVQRQVVGGPEADAGLAHVQLLARLLEAVPDRLLDLRVRVGGHQIDREWFFCAASPA